MKTFLDCIPCFVRQALDSVRLITDDENIHEEVLRNVLDLAGKMDLHQSPAAMGRHIHQHIRQLTGTNDPYRKIKDRFNQLALSLLPDLKSRIQKSSTPLETAVRLAIAGNIIDFGVTSQLDDSHVLDAIEHSVTAPLNGDIDKFSTAVRDANRILYLADNTGEIVFDRLLLEQLPTSKITVVVKGSPIINDATMIDAKTTGITDIVDVIDNGSDAPGTILKTCSEPFQKRFAAADLIIAKGQGNYETLSDVNKHIFFLLKAKCSVIAEHIGCSLGSLVLLQSTYSQEHTNRQSNSEKSCMHIYASENSKQYVTG